MVLTARKNTVPVSIKPLGLSDGLEEMGFLTEEG